VAVRLETLVYRDGCTLDQAVRTLRASGDVQLTDGELARLLGALPVRGPLRPHEAGEAPLEAVAAPSSAEERVAADESDRTRRTVFGALERVMARLPAEDRLIIQLIYWQGLSVADVARVRSLPQKPLYRRIERILGQLRRELPVEGVQPEQLREFLGELQQ
jgi:RNA polymerase sigma factor for flagellar operon FliA